MIVRISLFFLRLKGPHKTPLTILCICVRSLTFYLPAHCAAVQRTGVGLEDACAQKRAYFSTFEAASGEDPGEEDIGDDCTQHVEKKRRLSFDQVRSLEKNFEIENKLEPERKMQLARELGLQPRQVAVWFQNRRARWKTKQLERDYEILTSNYSRLKTDYDAVSLEKQDLQGEVWLWSHFVYIKCFWLKSNFGLALWSTS